MAAVLFAISPHITHAAEAPVAITVRMMRMV